MFLRAYVTMCTNNNHNALEAGTCSAVHCSSKSKSVLFFCFVLFCLFCFVLVFWIWIFRDRISLCSPGCPGTHSLDQAGLELRNLPASVSQSAGITGMCHHCPAPNDFNPRIQEVEAYNSRPAWSSQ